MSVYRTRREDLENQLNKGALWAVTYGDLMSYLMIFFLIMFSFTMAKTDKTKSRKYEESMNNLQKAFGGKVDQKRLDRMEDDKKADKFEEKMKETVQTTELSSLIQMQSNERKVKLVLPEGVLFTSGSATLKEPAKKILAPMADELKKVNKDIIIEGHTDNVPIKSGKYTSNWELSMARAYSVLVFFSEQGIPAKNLAGLGYGDNRPIGDNATSEGRAKNRRIEISLMKSD
ncbi:MAG: OmpA family protein [Elusimicrobiota bacterium]